MKPFSREKKKEVAKILLRYLLLKKKNGLKSKRKWWVHPIWRKRETHGAYRTLMREMRNEDHEYFKKFLRLTPEEFDELKVLLRPLLKKRPVGRKAIPVGEQLAITLRFMASGDALSSISFQFRIGFSTAQKIITNTCDAIWSVLSPLYMPSPTPEMWKKIAEDFDERWQYPYCLGAVDGKHVRITAPDNSGSLFFNYKHFYSIILMAVVDSRYKFVVVDVGAHGSNSDGGVWKNSKFGKAFDHNEVHLPEPAKLPQTDVTVPYVMVGDEGFQLNRMFMRPYGRQNLDNSKRVYNYRHSRARRCSENAFGIVSSRYQIFQRTINMHPKNCDKIVKAGAVMHNYLMTKAEVAGDRSAYCPPGFGDHVGNNGELIDGLWRSETVPFAPLQDNNQHESMSGEEVRQKFCAFFNNVGAVQWQDECSRLQVE